MACLCLQDNPSSYEGVQWVFPKAPRNAAAAVFPSAMITFPAVHSSPTPCSTLMHRYLYLHLIYLYVPIIGVSIVQVNVNSAKSSIQEMPQQTGRIIDHGNLRKNKDHPIDIIDDHAANPHPQQSLHPLVFLFPFTKAN